MKCDFHLGEIAALSKGDKVSMVVFRLHDTRSSHVMDRFSTVREGPTGTLERVRVRVLEGSCQRIRYSPISGD